ncbi:hypothetical protein QH494_02135 [Sphingomonas sp. AR_OL41]|uniref:hypothetical protein n=1 Tax=Sphingomonas sp. AR_OL41 TaxID=3042729 RepID=UPI00248182B4|nr:hypothetical protein [Sphingomonas sp. AR_OL41]MDH7970967.1 hypothetical protein [Sphingomonas sp. AR_OL41]
MTKVMRGVVALVGLFNFALGMSFLLDPASGAQRFFLTPIGSQGMATIRADFTAFFVTGAVFALIGAWRTWRAPLLVPMLLLGVAISGRALSLLLDGAASTAYPPMLVEAIMIAILALGWRSFAAEPQS